MQHYGVNEMYATIRTRSKVILRSMCDPFWCMQQYSANNGTWRNFFHKKQVSPFKKAISLFKKPVSHFKKPVSHLKTSMITLSQNFVSERAKSKLVTKLANQYHIFKKTDSHSKKPVSHFKKAVSHFKKAVSHFKNRSHNLKDIGDRHFRNFFPF